MKKLTAIFAVIMAAALSSFAWAASDEYDADTIAYFNDHGFSSITSDADLVKSVLIWDPGRSARRLRGMRVEPEHGHLLTGDLDLSQFDSLTAINIMEPAMTSITLSNPMLNDIRVVTSKSLSKITLGDLPVLRNLNISQTAIGGAFDISRFSELYSFKAIETKVTEASAVGMTKLAAFELDGCWDLKKVVVKDCPELKSLKLSKTGATDITIVGAFPKLNAIDIKDSVALESLDLSDADAPAVVTLDGSVKLASLKVKGMSKMRVLRANRTALTELDLTGCESLEKLAIRRTGIRRLVVTGCPKLADKNIDCEKDVEIVR